VFTIEHGRASSSPVKPWTRIDQALRTTDLLLQAGGFSTIVLDMGSIASEHAYRVALSMWFRYRAAAEQTQASVLLLAQYPCAKSSDELLLQLQPGKARHDEATIFTGIYKATGTLSFPALESWSERTLYGTRD
jgi:recombination protein RecA